MSGLIPTERKWKRRLVKGTLYVSHSDSHMLFVFWSGATNEINERMFRVVSLFGRNAINGNIAPGGAFLNGVGSECGCKI